MEWGDQLNGTKDDSVSTTNFSAKFVVRQLIQEAETFSNGTALAEGEFRIPIMDEMMQEVMLISMISGFGFVLAYVCCEQAPCHASPWFERIFLGSVASFLLIVLCVMYVLVWTPLDVFSRAKDVIVLFVFMMQHFWDNEPAALSPYKGPQPAARSAAAEHLGQAIIMAMAEVDAPINVFPSMSSGKHTPPIVRNMLPFFMFLLLLRLMLHPRHYLRNVVSALQWFGVLLIVITWVLNSIRYFFKKRKMTVRLIGLLGQVFEKSIAKQVLPMIDCPLLIQQIGETKEVIRFCENAAPQLGASGKAVLIDAMAKNGLSWGWIPRSRDRQELVLKIFESSTGPQLTKVKNYLDMSGDVFNLVYIFSQLTRRNKQRLIRHVENEAARLVHHGASPSKSRLSLLAASGRLKILSDIDDTLMSSGGRFPKGCDGTWPHSHCYPGVLSFYRRLDRRAVHGDEGLEASSRIPKSVMVMPKDWSVAGGVLRGDAVKQVALCSPTNVELQVPELFRAASGAMVEENPKEQIHRLATTFGLPAQNPASGAKEKDQEDQPVLVRIHDVDECNLVFLSARPHVHKDVAEAASYRVFWDLVHDRRVHTVPSLLPGSLLPGLQAFLFARCCHSAWRGAGMKKFSTFQAYAKLWPEYRFCFIGDNGQADVLCSEYIMKHFPDRAAACFIHEVQPVSKTLTSLRKPTVEKWAEQRIFFFGSYVGAAFAAYKADLLSIEDVAEITRDAVADYEAEYSKRRFLNFMVEMPVPGQSMASVVSEQDAVADEAVLRQLQADLKKVNPLFKAKSLQEIHIAGVEHDVERLRRYTAMPPDTNWSSTSWWDLEDDAEGYDGHMSQGDSIGGSSDGKSRVSVAHTIPEVELELEDRSRRNTKTDDAQIPLMRRDKDSICEAKDSEPV